MGGNDRGITQSFFDFYSGAAVNYRGAYIPDAGTGDTGWWVWAYTAQLGNGVSASISAEQRRMSQIIGLTDNVFTLAPLVAAGSGSLVVGALSNNGDGYGGLQVPDIVGNLRVDQTWGSAQVMGSDLTKAHPNAYPAIDCTMPPPTGEARVISKNLKGLKSKVLWHSY